VSTKSQPETTSELPGPNALSWIKRDEQFISRSYTRSYPSVIERGEGVYVWDVDGHRYLDFSAGIAVCSTGHCHPVVVSAIQEQAAKLIHMSGTDFYYPVQIQLAELLAGMAPGDHEKRVFFSNSGAESVECAFKLARYATGRDKVIAFHGGFHGRTMGALSLTASKPIHKKGFGALVPGVIHIPYAYCYRCAYHQSYPNCQLACVSHIEDVIFKHGVSPDEVAAILVEPIQGEGGYIPPPEDYHRALKDVADRHGILYIADEVQTGVGRAGTMFAIEQWGVIPDIITLAKGLASGMPLGATIARSDLMTWEPGTHASTFGGNPVACAAALASLQLIGDRYLPNVNTMGTRLTAGLTALKDRFQCIGDIRGRGLMIGVEMIKGRSSQHPDAQLVERILLRCFEQGLLLLSCGTSTVRFMPALIVNEGEIDEALRIFEHVLAECQ
jgi:4-aminobutyrate aminotransferase